MTTIKFSAYSDVFFVRCDLAQASATIQQSGDGDEWDSSQYQCADARHTTSGLVRIGQELASRAFEVSLDEFVDDSRWEEV